MESNTTSWRIAPAGWSVLALSIAAETVSNGLRAYGLGSHLDRFTISYDVYTVSLAGAVFVLAAVAVSLTQATAAWVALTPGRPARQRIVAGLLAILLLAISITAMASHILDAQRAKVGDERGSAGAFERAETAYKTAAAQLALLGNPRPVSVIQAEVQSTQIDMRIWRRSAQCSDISKEDTKEACKPILALYKERGAAASKAELEPEVARLREQLASMTPPAAAQTETEETVGWYWAWIMGLGVVLIATFGSVIFATTTTVQAPAPTRQPLPDIEIANDPLPLSTSDTPAYTRDEALADLTTLVKAGHHPESQDWLAARWSVQKGTISKWLRHWETAGQLPGNRQPDGRRKMVVGR